MGPTPREHKDAVYEQLARVSKALASAKRLELLDLLSNGPRAVEALAQEASLSVANTSQHLQVLRAARLVEAEKRGLFVIYSIAEGAEALTLGLRRLAEAKLSELHTITEAFLCGRDALEPVDEPTLLARALSGEVTVIDVRAPEEHAAGHLPTARSIPLAELRARLHELPPGVEVIAYCRGPWCVLAVEAVELLRAAGFTARRLHSGPADWRAAGAPVVTGP